MRLVDADKLMQMIPTEEFNARIAITYAPTVDIDAITESHEKIGFDKGFRDGYAQATVDAVEVVRCKDCRWYENDGFHTNCKIMQFCVEAEDYCSRWERREDETG